MNDLFRKIAERVSAMVGSVWAALLALSLIFGSGWFYNFSEQWKTNASFASTVSALLLLIFLQKSQNHSDKATHLKLDELVRAAEGARNEIVAAETRAEKHMDELKIDL